MPWTKRKTKRLILASDLDALLDTFILDGDSRYFPKDLVDQVRSIVCTGYSVQQQVVDIRALGSAKVGFGLMKKRTKSGTLPRFRPFGVFAYLEECAFDSRSRAWKKADLFTLLIELDQFLNVKGMNPQPSQIVEQLNQFYQTVDAAPVNQQQVSSIYYKAALQASNDRIDRVRRAVVIAGVLGGAQDEDVIDQLKVQGLA